MTNSVEMEVVFLVADLSGYTALSCDLPSGGPCYCPLPRGSSRSDSVCFAGNSRHAISVAGGRRAQCNRIQLEDVYNGRILYVRYPCKHFVDANSRLRRPGSLALDGNARNGSNIIENMEKYKNIALLLPRYYDGDDLCRKERSRHNAGESEKRGNRQDVVPFESS